MMHLQLHLSREQWREIYPHLDPDKLVDPPTPTKLERIGSRVETLAAMMATARELEKFVLMDAVYPLAKEVCIFFKNSCRHEDHSTGDCKKSWGSYDL